MIKKCDHCIGDNFILKRLKMLIFVFVVSSQPHDRYHASMLLAGAPEAQWPQWTEDNVENFIF
jgi:hypothetical protein